MAPYISRLTKPSSCCVSVVHLTPVVFEMMILLVFMRVFMPCFFSLRRSSVAEQYKTLKALTTSSDRKNLLDPLKHIFFPIPIRTRPTVHANTALQ